MEFLKFIDMLDAALLHNKIDKDAAFNEIKKQFDGLTNQQSYDKELLKQMSKIPTLGTKIFNQLVKLFFKSDADVIEFITINSQMTQNILLLNELEIKRDALYADPPFTLIKKLADKKLASEQKALLNENVKLNNTKQNKYSNNIIKLNKIIEKVDFSDDAYKTFIYMCFMSSKINLNNVGTTKEQTSYEDCCKDFIHMSNINNKLIVQIDKQIDLLYGVKIKVDHNSIIVNNKLNNDVTTPVTFMMSNDINGILKAIDNTSFANTDTAGVASARKRAQSFDTETFIPLLDGELREIKKLFSLAQKENIDISNIKHNSKLRSFVKLPDDNNKVFDELEPEIFDNINTL